MLRRMGHEDTQFSDRQVALVVKRASELQSQSADTVSLAQLHEIAAELDVPAHLVSRAVAELAVDDPPGRPVWWLGGKTRLRYEHVVPGRVDDAAYEKMLDVMRRCLGVPGRVEEIGSARIWSSDRDTTRRVHFTLTENVSKEHGTTTALRLEERMPMDARMTNGRGVATGFVSGSLGLAALSGLIGKAALMTAVGPVLGGFMVAGWIAGRQIWRANSRERERDLAEAFEALVRLGPSEAPTLSAGRRPSSARP